MFNKNLKKGSEEYEEEEEEVEDKEKLGDDDW